MIRAPEALVALGTMVIPLATIVTMGFCSSYPGASPIPVPMIGVIGAACWFACFFLAYRFRKNS
ncbi:MAG: hypothetical protein V4808_13745 [Pseudomonadota bacterium]